MFEYYRHFKGGFYRRIATARNCNRPEYEVEVYKALQPSNHPHGQVWYRERHEFHGNRGAYKRMRKLTGWETMLFLMGGRRFIKPNN